MTDWKIKNLNMEERKELKEANPDEYQNFLAWASEMSKKEKSHAERIFKEFMRSEDYGLPTYWEDDNVALARDVTSEFDNGYFGHRWYVDYLSKLCKFYYPDDNRNGPRVFYSVLNERIVLWLRDTCRPRYYAFGHMFNESWSYRLEDSADVETVKIFDRILKGLRKDWIDPETRQVWKVEDFLAGHTGMKIKVMNPNQTKVIGYSPCDNDTVRRMVKFTRQKHGA